MNSIVFVAAPALVVLAAVFAVVFGRLRTRCRTLPVTGNWIGEISIARYRPMERLLSAADEEFLTAAPGGGARVVRQFRAERRRLFRSYLRCLSRDFDRVCTAIKMLALESQQDRPDLAALIIRQKIVFTLALAAIEYRLLLHALGLGSVDIRVLVSALERMRLELRQLVPAAAPAAV